MSEDSISEFQERVQRLITSVSSSVANSSFQKVLYLVMIDGLSYLRFPDHIRPGDRFVGFVNNYGNWPECGRVSLPQADVLLSEASNADETLISAVSNRLICWAADIEHKLSDDPLPEELPDRRGILNDCQHGRLLWAFRNISCTSIGIQYRLSMTIRAQIFHTIK